MVDSSGAMAALLFILVTCIRCDECVVLFQDRYFCNLGRLGVGLRFLYILVTCIRCDERLVVSTLKINIK